MFTYAVVTKRPLVPKLLQKQFSEYYQLMALSNKGLDCSGQEAKHLTLQLLSYHRDTLHHKGQGRNT